MELTTIFTLSFIFLLTVYILQSWYRQHGYHSLPPGPTPIPVLGTPKYMDMRYSAKNLQKLSQKYGSLFTIWKMSEPVIVLCGYEMVKDALINHAEQFSARPLIPVLYVSTKGYGISGPRWRSLRRLTMTSLRNVGMGKKTMETRVLEESKYLIQAVSETGGKRFNPTMLMACAVGNILSSVLFGEHFEYKDEKLHELLSSASRHINGILFPLNMLCNIVPILLKVPIIRQKVFKENKYLQQFVTKYINHHKETLNPEAPRDYIDYYLLKIKEVEHEMDPDICETSLLMMIITLLSAGTETTASTLKFSLVFLAHYPEVQAKVQQEIDEVTKSLRLAAIMDKPQLPYTNAVIHEIQRVLDLASATLFHATTEDINFRGYIIPKKMLLKGYDTIRSHEEKRKIIRAVRLTLKDNFKKHHPQSAIVKRWCDLKRRHSDRIKDIRDRICPDKPLPRIRERTTPKEVLLPETTSEEEEAEAGPSTQGHPEEEEAGPSALPQREEEFTEVGADTECSSEGEEDPEEVIYTPGQDVLRRINKLLKKEERILKSERRKLKQEHLQEIEEAMARIKGRFARRMQDLEMRHQQTISELRKLLEEFKNYV